MSSTATVSTPRALAAPPPGSTAVPAPTASRAGLAVLLAALFVVTLDFFVVNVALPSMQSALVAGDGAVTVWVAGYAVGVAAFLVLGARLGDRWGRRRAFVLGMAAFTLASAACGAAPDATSLAVARVVQGLGAALVMPQVLSTITATTQGTGRVRALTAYGLTAGLAAISGQLVGGALIELDVAGLGWGACFLVNVPIGVTAVVLAPRVVPETHADARLRTDAPSVALLAVGLALLVVALAEGRQRGWPAWSVAALVVAPVLLLLFAARQRVLARRGADPLVDLAMFRRRSFATGTLLALVLQTGIASSFFVLALALQGGLGLGALESGLVFTTLAVGYVAASMAAPGLLERHGRRLLIAGAALSATGQAALAVAAGEVHRGGAVGALVPGLVVAGVGMGLLFSPSVSVALAGVDPGRSGEAAGVVTTVQQVGGALGVALLGVVFYAAQSSGGDAHAFAVCSWVLVGQAAAVGLLASAVGRRAA